jgi:hypothetical protein
VTITDPTPTAPAHLASGTADAYRLPAVDLYRDIHKGIRAELFAITATAGSLDPADRGDRVALVEHLTAVAAVLASHAHHEDAVIDPVLAEHLPELSEQIRADHVRIERWFDEIVDRASELVIAPVTDQRRQAHVLHLELAGFTGEYLVHQDVEERVVMPALERVIGAEGSGHLHAAIVSSIPPDEMARSLAFMLPAMNVLDRSELLGGIRAAAPAPAFDALVGLTRSVLAPNDVDSLAQRLQLV